LWARSTSRPARSTRGAELAVEVDSHHVVDRLNKVVHHDWEHSAEIDLSDEGLRADLDKRGGAGADKLALDPKSAHRKKKKH
jgi:hypothetical protein